VSFARSLRESFRQGRAPGDPDAQGQLARERARIRSALTVLAEHDPTLAGLLEQDFQASLQGRGKEPPKDEERKD